MTLLLRWVLRVCVVLAASVVLYVSVTAVQVWLTSRQTSENHANAIVVFGTAEYNGVPSADLEARLNETLALYQLGRAPLIAVTGGKQPGDLYSEAGVSAAYLHIHGVPLSKIVVGGGSDTYQNVQSITPGLQDQGVKTVLVVTDPFHEDRAMAILTTFGFSPSPDPTTSSPITGWATVPYFAKETIAVSAGRLVGYGRLSSTSHPSNP